MSDFTSGFWGIYISIITVVSIIACGVLLKAMSTRKVQGAEVETTGHSWDEDLVELNNPLPRWWIWLFYITILFGLAYLVLYPGLGTFSGSYQWTSKKQYEEEMAKAEAQSAPIYEKFAKTELKQLATDPAALEIGQKLLLNNCAQCHASDARGGKGYPNLTDGDWIYGGDPETIRQSILNGRNGPEGKGNPAIGAANLTKTNLLYGADEPALMETISKGRMSHMPGQKELLGEARVHILAAYVWSLSNSPGAAAAPAKAGAR